PRSAGKTRLFKTQYVILVFIGLTMLGGLYIFQAFGSGNPFHRNNNGGFIEKDTVATTRDSVVLNDRPTVLDTAKYDQLLMALNNGDSSGRWPVKLQYPVPGAVFPFCRVIAYYGNLYSKKMGVLGEYSTDTMFAK